MKTISIKQVIKRGWDNTKNNISFLVTYTFIYFVVYFILNKVGRGPGSFIIVLASMIVSTLFSIGMYRIALKIEEGITPTTDDFKSDLDTFLSVIWVCIISGFFVVLGMILFIIPGIYVACRLSLTTFVVLNKNIKGFNAVKESWRMTKGNTFKIFVLVLFSILITLIAVIPFALGLLISVPFIYLMGGILYKEIQRQEERVDSTVVSQ